MDFSITIEASPKGEPKSSKKLIGYIEKATSSAWEAYLCLHPLVRRLIKKTTVKLGIAHDGETVIVAHVEISLKGGIESWKDEKDFEIRDFSAHESPVQRLGSELALCFTKKVTESLNAQKIVFQQSKDEMNNLLDLPIETRAT